MRSASCASTLLFLPNRLPLILSVPVLAFLAGYSFAKRFTALAHFWLGTALALSPVAPGSRFAAKPCSPIRPICCPLVLGGAVLTWVAGFDIIYACQDYDVDITAGLHSVPVRSASRGALRLAAACHLATIVLLACLPLVYPAFGWVYWLGIVGRRRAVDLRALLVRPDDLSRVNAAFFNVNAVISLACLLSAVWTCWIASWVILGSNRHVAVADGSALSSI